MNQDEQLLDGLKQAVLDNLENEQFSVEHLSEIVGVSRSHLHRRLKKLKGQSISQFIREIRLAEALKLLRQDVATTSEIAYRVGFNSPSYFYKCFLEFYGYPPSEAKSIFQKQSKSDQSENSFESEKSIKLEKPVVSSSGTIKTADKQNLRKFKTIVFSIIALLFIAYSAFYFLKKDTVSAPVEKSIAVLPFNSLSEDEGNQHFADGLVEDLLNRLAMVEEFKVISRTSSDTYRERGKKKVTEIADELDVAYIVEGSVQKSENKVRIIIQLIDAKNDDHVWNNTYVRDLVDVFDVQSEIAMQVASSLSAELTKQQATDIQKTYTNNPKAFEFYQLGRYYWGKRLFDEYETAIYYFEKAITEDPNYALAYAGLADTYFLMNWQFSDINEIMKYRNKAEEYALNALELDERLAEAHTVLATLYFFIDWNWAKAEKTFLQALELNPNYSTLHHRYAEHLSHTGRHEEARKHINKAIELDPLSYVIRRNSTKFYLNQGQFQEALVEAQLSEELGDGNVTPVWYKFITNYLLEDSQAALENLIKLQNIASDRSSNYNLDSIFEVSGREGLLRWSIETTNSSKGKAELFTFLGNNEKALDWFETAFDEGDRMADVAYIYSPNNLHSHPRFIALMKKMNLPWQSDPSQ